MGSPPIGLHIWYVEAQSFRPPLAEALRVGAHITLFANCIQPLLRPKKTALLAYVITLFSLCTAAIGLQIWWTQVAFIDNHNYNGGPNKYLEDQVGSVSNKAVTLV